MSERGSSHTSERENIYWRSSFLSLGFTAAIGDHSIFEEVVGFSPLWFPRGKLFVSLFSCVFIDVHVILLVKDPKIIIIRGILGSKMGLLRKIIK